MAAKPLVVLVGPTGSGKTSLALTLAEQLDGEIICADSRTIYKKMDIGTAKPTKSEQGDTPHHLLELVLPNEPFTVADFKREADKKIAEIRKRGHVPILVGGSGLYVDAVIYDYDFRNKPNETLRAELKKLSVLQLQDRLNELGLELPNNPQNPRHLMRVIENPGQDTPKNKTMIPNTFVFGLEISPKELRRRCEQRAQSMLEAGLVEEVKKLAREYGWGIQPMQAPAYRAFRGHIEGGLSIEEATSLFVTYDMQLAKKQRTWFRRNKSIQWLSDPRKYVDTITTQLNKSL